jgi:hypothetical protein
VTISVAALGIILLAQAPDPRVLEDIQRSHIEANVPPPGQFATLLQRDLEAYFNASKKKGVRVEYELLRDGPTQSGVAYPKFYLWVRVLDDGTIIKQGAARVAAIARKKFDITSFVSEGSIRADPKALYSVFPSPVCERIKAQLRIAP